MPVFEINVNRRHPVNIAVIWRIGTPRMAKQSPQMTAAWIGSGCVVVAAIVTAVVALNNETEKDVAPGKLEVADILVVRKDSNAALDFHVMNRGGKSMSINRLRLTALSIEDLRAAGPLDWSGNYDLDISDVAKVGNTREIDISHNLQPGETYHFAVNLTARKVHLGTFRKWQFEPTIVTSDGEVTAKAFNVGLP